MATTAQLLKAQKNGAEIQLTGTGVPVTHVARYKYDRQPWCYQGDDRWYRVAADRCSAVQPEPEPASKCDCPRARVSFPVALGDDMHLSTCPAYPGPAVQPA